MDDYRTDQIILWVAIGVNVIALVVLFLKGRYAVIILSLAAAFLSPVAIYGTYWHHIITEPLRWWPLIVIFRLAKPSSRWADWFYREPKMQLARERYPTANPVPRRLRKEAIRNLGMIDKAAKTGDWGGVKELLRQRHPVEDHQQTQASTARAIDQSKIQEIISDGPERIGATIDACSEDPNRRHFAQALLDTALEP